MELFNEILTATFPAWSIAAISVYTGALLLYFIAEFKTKSSDAAFSLLIWIKDNYLNVIASTIVFAIYNFSAKDGVTAVNLFLLGGSSNLIIDWISTYLYYRSHQKK